MTQNKNQSILQIQTQITYLAMKRPTFFQQVDLN